MDSAVKVDLSALYEGIQDVLVELNVITDDNYTIVASHDGSGVFIDRVNPRMEVEITGKYPETGDKIKLKSTGEGTKYPVIEEVF